MGKMGQKQGYLFYYCLNLMLGKNIVPKICAKMLPASQIAEFLIIHFEQNDKKPDFLHVDADSWKLKIKKHSGGLCQKWVWPL